MVPVLRKLKFPESIAEALVQAMEKDKGVFIMGEGVDDASGIFGTTRPAFKKFGSARVFDMPLSEEMITGAGLGAALAGMRPVMVHARNDFLMLAMNQIVNHISKWSYIHQGKLKPALVIRALIGRGWGQAAQHSQSLQALFAHIPGLKVVMPTTPYNAKGLLLASIFDGAPVIFLEHRSLFNEEGDVPEAFYTLPLGKGCIHRGGSDVTVVGISFMALEALRAAEFLAKDGIEVEVVDPLSIKPLDIDLILNSVRKTGRIVIVDSGWRSFGVSAEIAALVAERAFRNLKTSIIRIGLPDAPTPCSAILEHAYYPHAEDIALAIRRLFSKKPASKDKNSGYFEKKIRPQFQGPF